MSKDVLLQVFVDDKLEFQELNPATKPSQGEFIDIPVSPSQPNTMREVYVGKVKNRYPAAGPTLVVCECEAVV